MHFIICEKPDNYSSGFGQYLWPRWAKVHQTGASKGSIKSAVALTGKGPAVLGYETDRGDRKSAG